MFKSIIFFLIVGINRSGQSLFLHPIHNGDETLIKFKQEKKPYACKVIASL